MKTSVWNDRFDGNRAMADLVRLSAIGPRPAGSSANERQQQIVAEHFRDCGGTVDLQRFQDVHPMTGTAVDLANVVGSWRPECSDRVLIGAHGDTRPMADREVDPDRKAGAFIGANDGASGVAALMELARHLAELPGTIGVDLVVFDAEELVFDEVGVYCLGSREFARRYRQQQQAGGPRYEAAVVLDMVAGRAMALKREGFSLDYATWLVEELWEIAGELGVERFSEEWGHYVEDDHLPLLAVGVPAIALVDIEFPEWHTLDDRPEVCSAASIAEVGRVIMAWLSRGASGA